MQLARSGLSTMADSGLDGSSGRREHLFDMVATGPPRLTHRTATVRLRATRRQANRCYGQLRSAGDVWAWLLDTNRQRQRRGESAISNYQALCQELTSAGPFGELSVTGARSVLQRYADAWFQAANRRKAGRPDAGFPRRKRALIPVRFYHGTFKIDGLRVRLPVASGQPALWVRLARALPYPPEQIRAVILLADGGRLWLAVTAAVPVQDHDVDEVRVAGVDLGILHPYAVVTKTAGLLVSGRASAPTAICISMIRSPGRPRRHAGTQARAARVAALATASSSGASGRSVPSPPRPSGPAPSGQAGESPSPSTTRSGP